MNRQGQKMDLLKAVLSFIFLSFVFLGLIFAVSFIAKQDKEGSFDTETNGNPTEDEDYILIEEDGVSNQTEEGAEVIDARTNVEKVLDELMVQGILLEFADQENYSKISDNGVLRAAALHDNDGLEAKIADAEQYLIERQETLQDAPDARSFFNASIKVCVAKSIFNDDLKNTCDISDPLGVDFSDPDDLTATETVLPYFLDGLAYYEDGDYATAKMYFDKIKEHKASGQARWEDPEFPLQGNDHIYIQIYDKTLAVLTDMGF